MNWRGWTMQREYVKCGKAKCGNCPHGPYWYGYQHREDGMRKRYFGKRPPWQTRDEDAHQADAADPGLEHPWDAINNRRTATAALAREILGLSPGECNPDVIRRTFYRLARDNHPDRGGDAKVFGRQHTAYSYLKGLFGS